MCQNNGTCVQHVRSFRCDCPDGFIGIFCQEKGETINTDTYSLFVQSVHSNDINILEPPFSITLINSSPRACGTSLNAEFTHSKELKSAECSLSPHNSTIDCKSTTEQLIGKLLFHF